MQQKNKKFCPIPFEFVSTQSDGSVSLCCWIKSKIGNLNFQSLEEAFNSKRAQNIRKSILDGQYSYCDQKLCPYLSKDSLPTQSEAAQGIRDTEFPTIDYQNIQEIVINHKIDNLLPRYINFCHDRSCNLECKMCRDERILNHSGPLYEKSKAYQKAIDTHLDENKYPGFKILSVTGSGDPFSSKVFRDFLFNFDGSKHPQTRINLQTNGTMFSALAWDKMEKIHNNLNTIMISFDAASKKTYETIRLGGRWESLLKNVDFIALKRKQSKFSLLVFDFVVEKRNYLEMASFIQLAKSFGPDKIRFMMLNMNPSLTEGEFKDLDVGDENHKEHRNFIQTLANPVFCDPLVDLGNVSKFYKRAISNANSVQVY